MPFILSEAKPCVDSCRTMQSVKPDVSQTRARLPLLAARLMRRDERPAKAADWISHRMEAEGHLREHTLGFAQSPTLQADTDPQNAVTQQGERRVAVVGQGAVF